MRNPMVIEILLWRDRNTPYKATFGVHFGVIFRKVTEKHIRKVQEAKILKYYEYS